MTIENQITLLKEQYETIKTLCDLFYNDPSALNKDNIITQITNMQININNLETEINNN
jgi:hypothetical protein